MQEYRINWLFVFCGTFLLFGVFQLWAGYLVLCFMPPKFPRGTDEWVAKALAYPAGLTLLFYTLREMAMSKAEKKRCAPEGMAAVEPKQSGTVQKPPPVVSPRQSFIAGFGMVSAIVGAASVVAHFVTGRVAVWEILLYTLGIPLCCTTGGYLLTKAKTKPVPETASTVNNAVTQNYVAPATAQTDRPTVEERTILYQRQGGH